MDENELHDLLSGKTEVPPVKSLERLELLPGDVLVLTYANFLTATQVDRLKDRMQRHFPDQKVLILDNGADLKVLRDRE